MWPSPFLIWVKVFLKLSGHFDVNANSLGKCECITSSLHFSMFSPLLYFSIATFIAILTVLHFWFHYIFDFVSGSLLFNMVNQNRKLYVKSSNLNQWLDNSWSILLHPHIINVNNKFPKKGEASFIYFCIFNWKWLNERKRYVDVIVSRCLRVEFRYHNKTGQILAVKLEDEESFGLTEYFFRLRTWILWWHNLWSYLIPYK